MNRYAIVEAPSILGLKPTGVDRLPAVLLMHGLADELRARRAGRVEPKAAYDTVRDPATLTLNARGIAEYSAQLANAVADVDGHADFYQPEANPNGEAASMDLAFATGHGPEPLANLEGLRPLVRDEDVVVFGFRDAEEQRKFGSQSLPPQMLALDLLEVRRLGIERAAQRAVEHLTAPERPTRGFFIHLDADVVSDDLMPAVDYRIPDGLSWDELRTVLEVALGSGRAAGLEVTIYNPALDESGASGRGLARTLIEALRKVHSS